MCDTDPNCIRGPHTGLHWYGQDEALVETQRARIADLEAQLAAMTAERDALRETNRTLNRRCQDLESENLRIMPRLKELENAYCLREVLPLVGDGDSYHASAKRLIAERDAEIRAHAETKAQAAAMWEALLATRHGDDCPIHGVDWRACPADCVVNAALSPAPAKDALTKEKP